MPIHEHDADPRIARRTWISDLDRALGQADELTRSLLDFPEGSEEAVLLRTRILAVRTELMVLREQDEALDRARLAPFWRRITAASEPR